MRVPATRFMVCMWRLWLPAAAGPHMEYEMSCALMRGSCTCSPGRQVWQLLGALHISTWSETVF